MDLVTNLKCSRRLQMVMLAVVNLTRMSAVYVFWRGQVVVFSYMEGV